MFSPTTMIDVPPTDGSSSGTLSPADQQLVVLQSAGVGRSLLAGARASVRTILASLPPLFLLPSTLSCRPSDLQYSKFPRWQDSFPSVIFGSVSNLDIPRDLLAGANYENMLSLPPSFLPVTTEASCHQSTVVTGSISGRTKVLATTKEKLSCHFLCRP